MKTKTVYVCDHCSCAFDEPCEEHEIKCLAEKKRQALLEKAAARVEPLCAILLGQPFDAPFGAKMDGALFLITLPIVKKTIKAISGATELVSTSANPSQSDAEIIKMANEILSS